MILLWLDDCFDMIPIVSVVATIMAYTPASIICCYDYGIYPSFNH